MRYFLFIVGWVWGAYFAFAESVPVDGAEMEDTRGGALTSIYGSEDVNPYQEYAYDPYNSAIVPRGTGSGGTSYRDYVFFGYGYEGPQLYHSDYDGVDRSGYTYAEYGIFGQVLSPEKEAPPLLLNKERAEIYLEAINADPTPIPSTATTGTEALLEQLAQRYPEFNGDPTSVTPAMKADIKRQISSGALTIPTSLPSNIRAAAPARPSPPPKSLNAEVMDHLFSTYGEQQPPSDAKRALDRVFDTSR